MVQKSEPLADNFIESTLQRSRIALGRLYRLLPQRVAF